MFDVRRDLTRLYKSWNLIKEFNYIIDFKSPNTLENKIKTIITFL
jgi:hypothetical protein